MRKLIILSISFLALSFHSCSINSSMVDNSTNINLDLNRFLGKWYEIARYPHSFEKNLQGVTATYSLREDGKIKVLNQGLKGSLDGDLKRAIGKAKIPDLSNPAMLKVSFFWIFYSDYIVMELDTKDYQWAVIGSSSPGYLWVLSRSPQMDLSTYESIIKKIEARNYDTKKLILVEQPMAKEK